MGFSQKLLGEALRKCGDKSERDSPASGQQWGAQGLAAGELRPRSAALNWCGFCCFLVLEKEKHETQRYLSFRW